MAFNEIGKAELSGHWLDHHRCTLEYNSPSSLSLHFQNFAVGQRGGKVGVQRGAHLPCAADLIAALNHPPLSSKEAAAAGAGGRRSDMVALAAGSAALAGAYALGNIGALTAKPLASGGA